jgi:hypothetical protein
MKRNNPPSTQDNRNHTQLTKCPRKRSALRLVSILVVLMSAAFGLAKWSLAQSVNPGPLSVPGPQAKRYEPPMTPEREIARLRILEPVEFAKEVDKLKSPQERAAEQSAIQAITQPRLHSDELERSKDKERKDKEKQARATVLDPVKHSGSVELLLEEVKKKKERGEKIEEILKPTLVSRNIPNRPAVKLPKPIDPPRVAPRGN